MTPSISENHPDQYESGDSTNITLQGSTANITNNDYSATSSDDDLSRLMNFAEQLKEKCEFYISKIEELEIHTEGVVAQAAIWFASFFVIIIHTIVNKNIYIKYSIYNIIIPICFLGCLVISARTRFIIVQRRQQIKKYTRKLRSEEVALEETVELLRNFGRIIADKQGWDELRKIELKLRLSRFEIGRYEIAKKYDK